MKCIAVFAATSLATEPGTGNVELSRADVQAKQRCEDTEYLSRPQCEALGVTKKLGLGWGGNVKSKDEVYRPPGCYKTTNGIPQIYFNYGGMEHEEYDGRFGRWTRSHGPARPQLCLRTEPDVPEVPSSTDNRCRCANGIPANGHDGPQCTRNNAQICKSCNSGYRLVGDHCVLNWCSCTNGYAARGSQCTEHNAQTCTGCHTWNGYKLIGDQCVLICRDKSTFCTTLFSPQGPYKWTCESRYWAGSYCPVTCSTCPQGSVVQDGIVVV